MSILRDHAFNCPYLTVTTSVKAISPSLSQIEAVRIPQMMWTKEACLCFWYAQTHVQLHIHVVLSTVNILRHLKSKYAHRQLEIYVSVTCTER